MENDFMEKQERQIKVTNDISSLKNSWEALYLQGQLSYCQSYEWAYYIHKWTQRSLFSRLYFGKVKYVCVKKSEKIVFIAPLVQKGNTAHLLAKNISIDYNGFVFAKETLKEDIAFFFEYLKSKGIEKLFLGRIRQSVLEKITPPPLILILVYKMIQNIKKVQKIQKVQESGKLL